MEEMGATPLLRNSRSMSSTVDEAQVVPPLSSSSKAQVVSNAPLANGDLATGIGDYAYEPVASKTSGAEDSKGLESPSKQALQQPRAASGATTPATSAPGASASSLVSRMVSMPTRSESIPRPPRPLVMSGSLNAGPSRGPARQTFFNQPSVASTSPWRNSSLAQHLANGSSDSLSRGVSPSPATPRGSSMPADSRRIYAPQGVASPQPSVGSPRSSAGMAMPGSLTPMTPRLPLQPPRTAISGYPSASSGALGGQQSLEGTARPRSVSAGQVTVPAIVSQTGGNLSARSVSTIPLTQYGARFSAVQSASSTGSMSAIRTPSRGATPQPFSTINGCRFVPVSSPLMNCEVQRGREGIVTAGSHRATSASTSITRGGSPTPAMNSLQAPHSSSTVVRQSSAVRPLASLSAIRQVSAGSTSGGSTTPLPGSFGTRIGNSGLSEDAPAVNTRAVSPPHVAAVAAAAAAAVKQGAMRHTIGSNALGSTTPQPSRYAYVNSSARRDCQPQANQREARRRGRM